MSMYDVLIIGAGPGGIFTAYELIERRPDLKIAIFEHGHELSRRKCPIDGEKIKSCIHCSCCSIMSGFGGAGAFSDGKYNITNDFGGTLYEYIGKKTAIELMEYVDKINLKFGGEGTKLYSTAGTKFKKTCMQHGLHLLDASVRHLGTDINYVVLEHLYDHLKDKVDFYFDCCIDTVNGHSYEDPAKQTKNTNFALLVAKHFSEPFKDSNEYGESIARLSNMLGGGVIVQRFGDLIRGKRSTEQRIRESFTVPTLNAAAGDLSLVLPKRILDGIIEMIYALDKVAPGTANDDTLLYGVEVKFYNMEVEVDENLMTRHDGLYVIGDGSGITHSLSHASASGVYVARQLTK